MVRTGLLVGMLLSMAAAEGAVPPPQPCCYIWAIEKTSAVILKGGALLRFRAAPSLIRTLRVNEFFLEIADFAPGSRITLHRLGSQEPRGWIWRPSDVNVVLEDFLPPAPACCRVESVDHQSVDRWTSSLTVRQLNGDGRYDAVASVLRGYGVPPVEPGAPASVDRDGRYLFVRVPDPGRTYVLEILPSLLTPGDVSATPHETIGVLRTSASMEVPGAGRFKPMRLDQEVGKRSALRRLQIEALGEHADAVIVTGCRVDDLQPRQILCEGEAIRRVKGKR